MIVAWMAYATGVGLLTALVGVVLDRLLRPHRIPVRGVWLGAMVLGVVLPAAGLLLEPLGRLLIRLVPAADAAAGALESVVFLDPLIVPVGDGSPAALVDLLLLGGWGAGSATLLAWWAVSHRRIRSLVAVGEHRRIGSQEVVVTADTGPAVAGIFRRRILLPRWLVYGDSRSLRMALEHEREHVRARDTGLLSVAFLLCVALPWNLPLWWMWRRLREGIEVDCDARFLRGRPRLLESYAETLLRVGARAHGLSATGAAALAESSSLLERRIRSMTAERPTHPLIRGVVLGLLALLIFVVACTMPEPGQGGGGPTEPDPSPETERIRSRFPPSDPSSSPERIRSDGNGTTPDPSPGPPSDPPIPEAAPELGDLGRAPTPTPHTVEPELENRDEVGEVLDSEYPSLLRDAGVGGTVTVWFLVDADGRLRATRIREPSGHQALDRAALRVARVMDFTPARNEGTPVPVWISLPVTFLPS